MPESPPPERIRPRGQRHGHPRLEQLAEATAGALPPDGERSVRDHLQTCPACQDRLAQLDAVRARLAAEPRPAMPPVVAARLQQVVAGAQAARVAAAAAPARPGLGPFRPDLGRPGGRRIVPALAGVAAAALVGLGGYVLSAGAGLDEPPPVAAVSSADLTGQASRLAPGVRPHRFSQAWFCARRVTDGPIVGIATSRVDGTPALLVYTRRGDTALVTVVTACESTPAAGPSAVVGR